MEAVCSRAIIIDRGEIVANGTPEELKIRSRHAGAVQLRLGGVSGAIAKDKLGQLSEADQVMLVSDDATCSEVVVQPKQRDSAALSEQIADLILQEGWRFFNSAAEKAVWMKYSVTSPSLILSRKEFKQHESVYIQYLVRFEARVERLFRYTRAFVFIVIFLVLIGFFTFSSNLGQFFEREEASLASFFTWHPWIYLFLVPSVGMRLWSEERRQTMELLLTMPVAPWHTILGKFLASWAFLALALLLTFPIILTTSYLGEPDYGPIACGYIGSIFLAGGYLAVSSMTSALTRNRVISFILSVVICLFLVLAGYPGHRHARQLGPGLAGRHGDLFQRHDPFL